MGFNGGGGGGAFFAAAIVFGEPPPALYGGGAESPALKLEPLVGGGGGAFPNLDPGGGGGAFLPAIELARDAPEADDAAVFVRPKLVELPPAARFCWTNLAIESIERCAV